ncbi:unnamed protein product [Moneuplotes crassus]|uniref:Uncharacterized protein n=1 Tax=Euplotes crassus TaxID=5936 RepID=A0AAD2D848_EUPCR|nr:unnamed protein product [Moneuplotes crassus]
MNSSNYICCNHYPPSLRKLEDITKLLNRFITLDKIYYLRLQKYKGSGINTALL